MKKFLAVALSAALVAGLAAGCGSDSNDAGSGAKTAKVIDVDLTSEDMRSAWIKHSRNSLMR